MSTKISLYVKIHNDTGLKYFGKTTKDPMKYKGSGKYWKKHLTKHGDNIRTEIVGIFYSKEEAEKFAINFSEQNNIVSSPEWANLIIENGLDGAPNGHEGHVFTEEQLSKISSTSKERWSDPEYKKKLSEKQKSAWTEERKLAQIQRLKGKKRPEHSEIMKAKKIPEKFNRKSIKNTEEHNKKISDALKGKQKTEEHIKNIRDSKLSRRHSSKSDY